MTPVETLSDNSPDREILNPEGCRALLMIGDKAYTKLIELGLPKVPTSNSYRHVRHRVIEWLASEAERLANQSPDSSSTETEP